MNIKDIKLEKCKKILDELVEKYIRNEIDSIYYPELAKQYEHESIQTKNYLKQGLQSSQNMSEIKLTIDVILKLISKYEK